MDDEETCSLVIRPIEMQLRACVSAGDEYTARLHVANLVDYAANVGLDSEGEDGADERTLPQWVAARFPFSALAMTAYKLGVASGKS